MWRTVPARTRASEARSASSSGVCPPPQGAHGLLQRGLFVVEVRVVEVDAIGLQALERGVRLAFDRLRAQVANRALAAADLRGQHDLVAVATIGQPAPDDRLRAAVFDQIRVCGVDEVASCADVRIEDGAGLWLVGGPAEHVAAEADSED